MRSVPLTLAAVLLLAAPSALAAWSSMGDREPNTSYDTSTWMQQDPAVSGPRKVYFNAFHSMHAVGPNVNVASLGTRHEPVPAQSPWAILGVWRDCNGDGYIGMAEGALREYDAALLLGDTSICPAVTNVDVDAWDGQSHNYNGWVSELIPIANTQIDDEYNTRQLFDPDVMIWADFGKPDTPSTTAGGSCPGNPLPRGTLATTGGLINYADCTTGLMGLMNLPWSNSFTVAGNEIDGVGDPLGLRFEQNEFGYEDARGHAIWDQTLFGDESSERSAIYYADCSAEPTFDSGETLNESAPELSSELTQNITVYQPDPRPGTTDATVPGTFNATNEELNDDCDYTNDREGAFYGSVEDDVAPVLPVGKRAAQYNYEYTSSTRGHRYNFSYEENGLGPVAEAGDLGDELVIEPPVHQGQAGIDDTGGQGVYPLYAAQWWGGTSFFGLVPPTVATRINVREGTADPGPDAATWISQWAYVGPAITDQGIRLPGGSAKYGAAQCGLHTSGEHNGWDCDAANWNLNTDGTPNDAPYRLAVPGSTYNLRDIDCWDGGNDLGVGLGVPYYGDERCN